MSDVSTVVDRLVAAIGAALPADYVRVANPYLIETNDQMALAKGFGVAVGPGRLINAYLGGRRAYERSFNVLIVNLMTALPTDVDGRAAQDKALLEDFRVVSRALERDQTLSGVCTKIDYQGDSGVVFSEAQIGKFISISIDLAILYEEAL